MVISLLSSIWNKFSFLKGELAYLIASYVIKKMQISILSPIVEYSLCIQWNDLKWTLGVYPSNEVWIGYSFGVLLGN